MVHRTQYTLALSAFYHLSYERYRLAFQSALHFFELPTSKIYLQEALGGTSFLAHKKGQKADRLALRGRCRSLASIPHYLHNVRAILASIKLGNRTHTKLR